MMGQFQRIKLPLQQMPLNSDNYFAPAGDQFKALNIRQVKYRIETKPPV